MYHRQKKKNIILDLVGKYIMNRFHVKKFIY